MPANKDIPVEIIPGQVYPGAGDLNRSRSALIREVYGSGQGLVTTHGNRTNVHVPRSIAPQRVWLQSFVVVEELDDGDLLSCILYHPGADDPGPIPLGIINLPKDLDIDGNEIFRARIKVAKPFMLQKTPWDGASIVKCGENITYAYGDDERTSTGSSSGVKRESITPCYFFGDIIVGRFTGTDYQDTEPAVVYPGYKTSATTFLFGSSDDVTKILEGSVVMFVWNDGTDRVRFNVSVDSIDADTLALTFSGGEGDSLPADGSAVSIAPQSNVVWQDINEGARIWSSALPSKDINSYRNLGVYYGGGNLTGNYTVSVTPVPNVITALPFLSVRGGTLNAISLFHTSHTVSSNVRLAIYEAQSDVNLHPRNLIFDSGNLSVAGPTATIDIDLKPNTLYWLCYLFQDTSPDPMPVFAGTTDVFMYDILGVSGGNTLFWYEGSFLFAAFPDPCPTLNPTNGTAAFLAVKYSA